MATQAEIKDQAVALLGEEIGIYQAPDIRAAVDAFYPTVRDELLYGYPWSWAITRQVMTVPLQQNAAPTDHRYPYVFNIPDPDVGQVRALYNSAEESARPLVTGWTREGNQIYARWPKIWIEYQRHIDETAYPALFVSALVPLLTSRAAIQVTQDPQIMAAWARVAEQARMTAEQVDAQSKPNEGIVDYSYVDAHYGGTGGFYDYWGS